MNEKPAQTICPLCGGDNQCAVAAGAPPQTCWCMTTTIDKDLLATAAPRDRQRCICPQCAQKGMPASS